ncbi:MAG: hypothetical protein O6926_06095 [candidate division NC10 bacterium]|nr:hypothetical protein [candidate division NC10 bacterium]
MPFILIDEEKKKARDGNDFDELPPGVTPDDVVKLIVAATLEGIVAMVPKAVQEALRPYNYALTGNVDYLPETTQDRPRGKK